MEEKREILGETKVIIEMVSSLKHFNEPNTTQSQDFKGYLLQYLDDLVTDLTIPVEISLHIRPYVDRNESVVDSYQVFINDGKCRQPFPMIISQDVQAKELARSVANVIHQNLELIVTVQLSEKIRENWISENGETHLPDFPENEFHKLLLSLVIRGFMIDRVREIIHTLKEKESSKWNAENIFEEIISKFDTTTLRIFFKDDGIKTQSAADDQSTSEMFEMMNDGLLYELGIILPVVTIDTDESLEENEFRIQLNDVRLPPDQGLEKDEFLVNDTADRLTLLNLIGKRAVNPANGSECAIVQDKDAALEICHKAGLTTWGPTGFIVLSLSAEVRRNAGNFLTTGVLKFYLDRMSEAFPALVDTALKSFNIIMLTRILRDLLDEELSIRNLRGILEALLAIKCTSVLDENENYVFSFYTLNSLRTALNRYISNKYTSIENTLVCYLLNHNIETRISTIDKEPLTDEEHAKLIKAIYSEVGGLSSTSQNPIILTTLENRKKFKNLIEKEFPRIAVLCYQELSPDLNIQPIARIELKN